MASHPSSSRKIARSPTTASSPSSSINKSLSANTRQLARQFTKQAYHGLLATLARRDLDLRGRDPLISFTFDDFPRSAYRTAGAVLEAGGGGGGGHGFKRHLRGGR